jgi:hypothetical protein
MPICSSDEIVELRLLPSALSAWAAVIFEPIDCPLKVEAALMLSLRHGSHVSKIYY